ncbi:hypothetical protein D9M68_742430 [compost metagenome]
MDFFWPFFMGLIAAPAFMLSGFIGGLSFSEVQMQARYFLKDVFWDIETIVNALYMPVSAIAYVLPEDSACVQFIFIGLFTQDVATYALIGFFVTTYSPFYLQRKMKEQLAKAAE